MNPLALLAGGLVLFILASRFYARVIAKNLGSDETRPTPAVSVNDGRDFVPTRIHVLFAHHFSTIAGAGPILGPTMVLLYGYMPAWLWIVLGCVFFGAVHDFSALFVSIREGGRSMADVARSTLGQTSFILFILFTITLLVLVTSNFLAATSISLTSMWPIEKLGLDATQTFLNVTVDAQGRQLGVIGGIASTSVVIITLFAPVIGYLNYRRGIPAKWSYLLAATVCIGSIIVGVHFPITMDPKIWMAILSVYVLLAATLPVWFILQPRDFINAQILYIGMTLLALGVLINGFMGSEMNFPIYAGEEGAARLGSIWPMLFITVACGAISGFHALVAGGTTAKQIATERDAKKIGFDGMLLEGALALLVVLALCTTLSYEDYKMLVWPTVEQAKIAPSNPILAFSLGIGILLNNALGLPQALATVFGILLVEGFVITTLDSAVRLNRYLFEELWMGLFGGREKTPRIFLNAHFNSFISVLLMAGLAFTNSFSALWPIFGTSNQLLAALTLTVISAWLIQHGRKAVYTLVPALFLMVTTFASLITLLDKYMTEGKYLLLGADIFLMILSLVTALLAILKLRKLLFRPQHTA